MPPSGPALPGAELSGTARSATPSLVSSAEPPLDAITKMADTIRRKMQTLIIDNCIGIPHQSQRGPKIRLTLRVFLRCGWVLFHPRNGMRGFRLAASQPTSTLELYPRGQHRSVRLSAPFHLDGDSISQASARDVFETRTRVDA